MGAPYILRVNTGRSTWSKEPVPGEWVDWGGRGLTGHILLQELDPTCEPLGPRNKIIMAPGLLGGTPAPCTGRLSVGTKSPLTGTIKEANVGGTAAQKLARLGIKAIVVEGSAAKEWVYLHVSREGVKFLPAGDLVGLGNYDVGTVLLARHGKRSSVISIGPAGERQYASASIAVTNMEGMPSRHAARGGPGAVLGSKHVKAIVVEDSGADKVPLADEDRFRELAKSFTKELVASKKVQRQMGTANLVLTVNTLGCLPTKNFSLGSFSEAEKISGQRLRELILQRKGKLGHACHPGCAICCSNIFVDEEGSYITSGLEYETIALTGSNLMISNLDTIARIDRFCDDFGVDTIETGNALGVAMEAGLLSFGDDEGVLAFLENEMWEDTVAGRLVAQGATTTGKVLGVKRVAAAKGQAIPAYDPRGLKGTGVTYATSPMGADHTAGNVLPGRVGYRPETAKGTEPASPVGQVPMSHDLQILTAVCDVLGICFFVGATAENMELFSRFLSYAQGRPWTREEVIDLGVKTIYAEVEFNRRAGIGKEANRLPEFFMTEKLPPYDLAFDVPVEQLQGIWSAGGF
jgi:aldehyde:ferredoxin oxidoreductase